MSIADIKMTASKGVEITPNWEVYDPDEMYQCHAILCPEADGGFSAHCANLVGVISQGDDEAEALENVADCFRETIRYYRDSGQPIPWGDVDVDRPAGFIERWIAVRV